MDMSNSQRIDLPLAVLARTEITTCVAHPAGGPHAAPVKKKRTLPMLTVRSALVADIAPISDLLMANAAQRGGQRLLASAGILNAGSVRSLIPPKASARFDIRLPPGITMSNLKASLESLAREIPGTKLSYPKGWDASWEPLRSDFTTKFGAIVEHVRGKAPRHVVRLLGSDARHWRDRGVPAVCFGPQPTLSAGVDDYANEQDVVDCAKIYAIAAVKLMIQAPKSTQIY